MNVSLTPELEKFVADTVATGRYSSASEVVRAALRMLDEEERWKAHASKKLARALVDIEAGKIVKGERAMERIRDSIAAKRLASRVG